jgi:serine/threonine protein kinase/Tfp pilus assembly protein PilF
MQKCSECGAESGPDSPGGHCLACLLRLGLAPERPVAAWEAGARVGHYHLREKLGEGGHGIVYLAEQAEPVRRQVALKVIKPGMDTHEVLARFEAERQVLALLEHPNIPKIFDAGATDSGHPFFVMELVRGVKITDYCDRERLSLCQRLELFIPICQTMQHAHQKGVIHRDLKPANILIVPCSAGAAAAPKIIDFGIAKSMEQRIKDQTTTLQQFTGTPAYMSPEQAGLDGKEIDRRSDLYSLGVLLYELLTGCAPFDAATMRPCALDQVLRHIREAEPPRPSARVSSLSPRELTAIASCRQIEPRKLPRLLRGELDWIVMKCLEKERARRYESASDLALDVQNFLAHKPVSARPPATVYRLKKLVRRNRLAFLAGGAVAAALAIGIGVSTGLLFEARTAERGAALAQASGLGNLGAVLCGQGRFADAEAKYREALAIRQKFAGRENSAVAVLLNNLAVVLLSEGRPGEAESMNRQALETDQKCFGYENQKVAFDLGNLANALAAEKKFTEAEKMDRAALAIDRKISGDKNPDVPVRLKALAKDLAAQGKIGESEAVLKEQPGR